MTPDAVPYVGQYSARTPGLYVATGFNKWGLPCYGSRFTESGQLTDNPATKGMTL